MDTFIPIILAIAFFIFQAYLGVKKEQEKAAKRNLGKPGPPPVATPPASAKKATPQKRDWLEELLNPQLPQPQPAPVDKAPVEVPKSSYEKTSYKEPRYETFYKPEKYVPAERPVNLLEEYRKLSDYEENEEVRRAKKLRTQRKKETKRLETLMLEVDDLEIKGSSVHFDLEEAIIMKAILERPYS